MESYSLHQLNEYIRRVIALNFREPLWIEAEITQCNNSRGNYYLELIEKKEDSEEIIAQAGAAIWYRKYKFIEKKVGPVIHDLLKAGTQVRLKCTVDFNERYGFKLIVEDLDPKFTFGQLELKRQQIIQRLNDEGLMEINKQEILPTVVQKVAVISSERAAGYQDFYKQLLNNPYGYKYDLTLFQAAVQGDKVEAETVAAINEIITSEIFDVAVIIRGGGSKLDLSGYDNYMIAKSIAISQIPFVIGIGHDIDNSVTDMVSSVSLKTPTAVADFLIDHNMDFEYTIEESVKRIMNGAQTYCQQSQFALQSLTEQLRTISDHLIKDQLYNLTNLNDQLLNSAGRQISSTTFLLEKMALMIEAKNPNNILNAGYSYVSKNGKSIKSSYDLRSKDEIEITFSDGSLNAQIQ